jgi:hypothetical protein
MTDPVRVFVDERPVEAPAGATVAAAVSADDPDLAAALRDGRAYVTDGVGRPIDPGTPVFPGAIVRVVRSARRSTAE